MPTINFDEFLLVSILFLSPNLINYMGASIFHSQNGNSLSLDEVMEEILRFVQKHPERFYKVVIGSDSAASNHVSLITAITVWRVGNGAIHFWTRSELKTYHSFRDRIWDEAIKSITLAQEVRGRLGQELGDEFFWDGNEIHVDAGRNGITRELVDGVMGMIRGYDFEPVVKPYSFGASSVADRHT